MHEIKLKVCGINDTAVAVEAERLGVDYLGFIFAAASPRKVTPEQVREIVRELTGRARRVGVFTQGSAAGVAETARRCSLDVVQLHWRVDGVTVAELRAAGFEVWTLAGGAPGDAVLFDSSHGDGERNLVRGAYRTVLAGGISEDNVAEALAQAPDILDVSGSLETTPGVKSIARLRSFIRRFHGLIAG